MIPETSVHLAGIVTLVGAVLYAIADVLLLAHHVGRRNPVPATAIDFAASDRWQRRAQMLTCSSKMPWRRLVRGGLLGVFVTPFVMSGSWVLYRALQSGGWWLSAPVALLWLGAYPIGAFIHGSFIYLGAVVQAWNVAEGPYKSVMEETVSRVMGVLLKAYVVFYVVAIVFSLWYVVAVLQGTTALPRWMALMNPALMAIVYTVLARKVVPFAVMKYVQGAGYNIVYAVFFVLLLVFIW